MITRELFNLMRATASVSKLKPIILLPALDPYGGAITGIVGVNRDIIGTGKGAKPIFNTNVLCFGPPDTPPEELPKGLLHPKRVLRGVHHGIVDGGNQSGIPVAAGRCPLRRELHRQNRLSFAVPAVCSRPRSGGRLRGSNM